LLRASVPVIVLIFVLPSPLSAADILVYYSME